jgi:acyl-CoA thioester hydrolase
LSRAPALKRSDYTVWRTIPTRWADNDIYGHVNNVVYYEWFDTAVNGWLIDEGLLTAGSGVIGLVAETSCTYFAPVAFPGHVEVGLAAERIGSSSIIYRLGVFADGSDDPNAQGRFVHVCVDRASHRPVPIPLRWRSALAGIGAG